jgi:hypothetical protein
MTDWYSIEDEEATQRLLASWPDAPLDREEVLGAILDVARVQVIAFGQGLPEDSLTGDIELVDDEGEPIEPPARFVYAQLQQSINLWNAGRVSSAGEAGPDGYSFTPRPLDQTIRGIIRPLEVTNVF